MSLIVTPRTGIFDNLVSGRILRAQCNVTTYVTTFISIALIVIGTLVSISSKPDPEFPGSRAPRAFGRIMIGLGVLVAIFSLVRVVQPGQVAVASILGRVSDRPLEGGIHLVAPFSELTYLSSRTEQYTMVARADEGQISGDDSVRTVSKDGLILPIDITVNYRINSAAAPMIFKNIGSMEDIVQKILRPAARSAVRDASAGFTAQEAYSTKRDQLGVNVAILMEKHLKKIDPMPNGGSIIIQQVLVRNIELPQKIKDSIESKLAAEQDALRMEYTLQKERQESERKRIEAKGISDFQAIVSQGISDKLLAWKGIEATQELAKSPNAKIVIVGNNKASLPVILSAEGTK